MTTNETQMKRAKDKELCRGCQNQDICEYEDHEHACPERTARGIDREKDRADWGNE